MAKNINLAYDWLNIFTKVSERLYLAFIFKMGKKTPAQKIRATELRKIEKSKRRQAYFITDYMQVKYYNHYHEAACFFNTLNTLYSTKPDLRKTPEYRNWRAEITTGQNLSKPRRSEAYENINISMHYQNHDQPQSPEPESPQNAEQLQPRSPQSSEESQPRSPQSNEESQPRSPQSNEESLPRSPQSNEESQHQSPQNANQLPWEDNMQLKIPLINYDPSTPRNPEPAVTVQTLETVTEQAIDQSDTLNQLADANINESNNNTLNHFTVADINENIARIIKELRQDPDLHNIFDDMEVCEEIDINEDIRLEQEILTW